MKFEVDGKLVQADPAPASACAPCSAKPATWP